MALIHCMNNMIQHLVVTALMVDGSEWLPGFMCARQVSFQVSSAQL